MENISLNQLINAVDTAIHSDNPAVINCLNDLILVTSLVPSNEKIVGPLRELLNTVDDLTVRVTALERNYQPNMPYGNGYQFY